MGTVLSRTEEPLADQQTEEMERPANEEGGQPESEAEAAARRQGREDELRQLKEQLAGKRAQRREALDGLRRQLEAERAERLRLEAVLEEGQSAEVEGLQRQVAALKDVAKIGGEMLRIRELQVNELKEKLKAIEETGAAYEKEVENMRKLKGLYEERSRAMAISHQMELEREKTRVVAAETRLELAEERNRELVEANRELQERVCSLDSTVDRNNNEISELRVQLAGTKEELYSATSQMGIVNSLFSQLLADPESLDRVTRVLEEHHDLVNHLTAKGNITDVASVLMRVADKDHVLTGEEQDIATNLGKVWRLLVELLGHHSKQAAVEEAVPDSCYKSVDTPSGPKLVISVSQTFLRLKDLILEKNSLVKEVGRLKDLNTHLEQRLISQESRLVEVAEELHKTWGVVNKLKSQHKAIHTHEQVLRYEFKHKRMMLNELKQQLEECREMWQMARVKNNQTEKDWNILRKEFADRKQQISSAESGYEESPGDSQDEDSDMQDFPSASNPRCLRIRRLHDSELSTPDRSNTPEVPRAEASNSEEIENVEVPDCKKQNEPTTLEPDDVSEEASVEEPEAVQSPSESLQNSQSTNRTVPEAPCPIILTPQNLDDLTVEFETTVQIVPWNDGPEEFISEATQETSTSEPLKQDNEVALSEQTWSGQARPVCGTESSASGPPSDGIAASAGSQPRTSAEEILARREARLKRLEEQCKHLFNKVSNTNKKSDMITSKLVELHEHYGDSRGETSSQSPDLPAEPGQTQVTQVISQSQTQVPEEINQSQTEVPEEINQSQTQVPEVISQSEAEVAEEINQSQTQVTEVISRSQTQVSEEISHSQTQVPEVISHSQTQVPEVISQPEAGVLEVISDSQADVSENSQVTPGRSESPTLEGSLAKEATQ